MSTKIHAATDALGNPVRLLFGPGQRHDVTRSHELVSGLKLDAVTADKGYDADHLRNAIREVEAKAVIPSRSNRKAPRDCDKALYRERNLVDIDQSWCLSRVKGGWSGPATRHSG